MEPPARLPLDVLGYIVDILAADSHSPRKPTQHGSNTLKKVCLTCKFMVPLCRRHLFARMRFPIFPKVVRRQENLKEFLLSNSTIAHYVRHLRLDVTRIFITLDYDFLQKICDSSSATSIDISAIDSVDWTSVPEETKSITCSLLGMPTIRHITFRNVRNFPASALFLCSGLNQIVFHGTCSLVPPDSNSTTKGLTITSLEIWQHGEYSQSTLFAVVYLMGRDVVKGPRSFIAFDHLKSLALNIGRSPDDISNLRDLLERAICLEWLQIQGEFLVRRFLGVNEYILI